MKHALPESLDQIEDTLAAIRRFEPLTERTRGVFYLKSRAFLHFHDDHGVLYADVRLGQTDFDRFRIKTMAERRGLLATIRRCLSEKGR